MNWEIFWPPAKDLAERFGLHITTARRYRREQNAPSAIVMLLSGDVGILDPKWAGWHVRDGCLYSPEGLEAPMNEVRALPFMRVQIAALQHDVQAMREFRDTGLENQPEPVEWDLTRVLAG